MSRTKRNKGKPAGLDFWSRRCFGNGCMGYGKSAKWITKRKERARDRRMCQRVKHNPDDYDKRFSGE